VNLAKSLHAVAARLPAASAVTQSETTMCYGELSERVARSAAFLFEAVGRTPGARVGIAMENDPAFLQMLYACWHAGLCAVPMNAKLHPREFAYILSQSGAAVCLASPPLHSGIAQQMAGNEAIRVLEIDGTLVERMERSDPMPIVDVEPQTPAWLFYTSGTTGRPKGATITVRNLWFMTLCYYADIDELDERDTIVHAAPLSHGSGLYALPHIARGSHNVISASGHFSPGEMFALLERYRRVSFFAAPTSSSKRTNMVGAAQVSMENLKAIMYGGGPMYRSDLQRALAAFGPRLYQIYGQGESPMTITGLSKRVHEQAWRAGDTDVLTSAGASRTGVEVRLVDDDDHDVPCGEIGEIVTRSDCVMQGYWNNPEANVVTLRGGWLHTGDLGSMDARGFVTIKDRSKDMIISGGSNIYPREIEDVLLQHPNVAQASVVGAAHAEWGEEVVAFIVPQAGASLASAELDALCLEQIARYKRPRRYVIVADLPKNNYGKVLKTELRERLGLSSS
jgi:long-chain acyl-CoA synthetase